MTNESLKCLNAPKETATDCSYVGLQHQWVHYNTKMKAMCFVENTEILGQIW